LDPKKYETAYLDDKVAICTPGVRTVVILAWCDDDGSVSHEVHPVLAIRTFVRRQYFAPRRPDTTRPQGGSHEEMVELGWRPQFMPFTHVEGVVVDPEYGLIDAGDPLMTVSNSGSPRYVACTWDPGRDGENLASEIMVARRAAESQFRLLNKPQPIHANGEQS
jgi:hypothetical protein